MFQLIQRKLSLKVSVILTLIVVPVIIAGALVLTARETARVTELTIGKARAAAITGARAYGALLEAGVDSGEITINDLLQPTYEEIKGYDFGENPRFHTKYDGYTDRVISGLLDSTLASSNDFLSVVGSDVTGYTPTHNSKFTQPLTGDRAKDLIGNRTKRKFNGPVPMKAVTSLQPILVQDYIRDTGEPAWDVSAPVYVRGNHWGAFRVLVSKTTVAQNERALRVELLVVFGLLGAITVGFIFFMLRRSMKPLVELTELSDQISLGEGLDREIQPKSTDEIGQMAKSMNRLRASLQVVMSRLGE